MANLGLATSVDVSTKRADVHVEQQDDGSVIVSLETKRRERKPSGKFNDNLADDISAEDLTSIATQLIEGIDADISSRSEWVANYNKGLELLGLKIEDVNKTETQTSTVKHPLLLWAIVKFQSLAQAELLPANGPAKVRNDGDGPDEVAEDLQRSINWYMTVRATEYYPDTDRGLFYLGYGGTIYKKVYRCALRQRPVSESVYLPDLIVSQNATDLQNASRITHRIEMTKSEVTRYQRLGYWRDVDLPEPTEMIEPTDTAEAAVTGIAAQRVRREDWPYNIYECYCTLDLTLYGKGEKGQDEGIEYPYRVTIERDSRQIMEIRRNWKEKDELKLPRRRFVKWGLIPGLGFLDFGYLHLLGNYARALTALERILIDAGIFSTFPGGVKLKGMRMETNLIRPAPGEFVEIDAGGAIKIQDALMPLPFKGPMAEVITLLQGIEAQAEKLAGQIDIVAGEGSTNVPVGTIMAQIEQATQTIMAVHKRLHQAQGEELSLLRELWIEEPEQLHIPDSEQKWTPEQLASASLVPASDPNIPAHIHRIMQAWVLETLSTTHPELYNQREVQKRILQTARITDYEQILMPVQAPNQGPTDPTAMVAMLQAKLEEAQLAVTKEKNERDAALRAAEIKLEQQREARETATSAAEMKHTQTVDEQKSQGLSQDRQGHLEDLAEQAADRVSREKIGMKEIATSADADAAQRESDMNLSALEAIQGGMQHQNEQDTARRAQDLSAASSVHAAETSADTARHATETGAATAARAQDTTAQTAKDTAKIPPKPKGKKK